MLYIWTWYLHLQGVCYYCRYYAPALGFLMFAVGVNSSAKDLIETIKRPDAIAAGYIGQFVKLVTVDDPFITTDYMVCPSICCVRAHPAPTLATVDEATPSSSWFGPI
jgi:hypothetical protein